jgi:hypothetical protein
LILESIYSILFNDASVNAAVSGRIYPNMALLGADYPLIVFSNPSSQPVPTKDSASVLDLHDIQIDIYSTTALEAGSVSSLVRSLLDRYTGTIEGHNIQGIQLRGTQMSFEIEQDLYRIILSFSLRECL